MTVGVTGHQQLPESKMWDWVVASLDEQIAQCRTPLVGFTCLAVGADQHFARTVLAHGGKLHLIKPFEDYERTFDASGLEGYRALAKDAELEVLNIAGTDEDAYLAAGERVADHSDRLFAIWNGLPAQGRGGTADIVRYALENSIDVLHLNPLTREIKSLSGHDSLPF